MKKKLKYFIGMDVHKSTTSVCVLDAQGEVYKTQTLPTTEKALREYLQSLPAHKGLVLEECDLAQWLYIVLRAEVEEIVVCDPYQNHLLKKGPKNDQVDCLKLAELYRAGLVSRVFHGDDSRIELRKLTAAYRETVKAVVRSKNQSQAILRRVGSKKENLSALEKRLLEIQEERLEVYLQQMDLLQADFAKAAKRYPEIRLLDSLPGIGLIGAVKVVATVVDPKRFPSKHEFWSYCGLVRHFRESAGKRYGSHRARGNTEMKNVFKTAACVVLRGQGPMRQYYDHLREKRLAEHDARHAVARKIASIALGCWKSKKRYDRNYKHQTGRNEAQKLTNLQGRA